MNPTDAEKRASEDVREYQRQLVELAKRAGFAEGQNEELWKIIDGASQAFNEHYTCLKCETCNASGAEWRRDLASPREKRRG